jgi:hypothetical protein
MRLQSVYCQTICGFAFRSKKVNHQITCHIYLAGKRERKKFERHKNIFSNSYISIGARRSQASPKGVTE